MEINLFFIRNGICIHIIVYPVEATRFYKPHNLNMPHRKRWGIIGPGKIARKFAHDLRFSKSGYLYATASLNPSRLEKFQQDYPADQRYDRYEDLLSDPMVDIVYIATPHSHHYPWILKCLDHGKHVLCEKPLCINANQVRAIMKKQEETGLFVMEALWTRFLPAYIQLRNELKDSTVQSLSADFCYHSPRGVVPRVYEPALAGGSLLDIGIYPLFLALDIMGPPRNFQVSGWVDQGVDVRMAANLLYDKGRSALLYSDVQSATRMDAVIRMEDRVYVIPHQWHRMDHFLMIQDNVTTRYDATRVGWGYYHEIEHVHECLLKSWPQSPLYPLTKTLELTGYMDSFRRQLELKYPDAIEKI